MSIILISPYGSNDLLIRFTHSAVRQFKVDFLHYQNYRILYKINQNYY